MICTSAARTVRLVVRIIPRLHLHGHHVRTQCPKVCLRALRRTSVPRRHVDALLHVNLRGLPRSIDGSTTGGGVATLVHTALDVLSALAFRAQLVPASCAVGGTIH